MIKWDYAGLRQLDKAMTDALEDTGEKLGEEIKHEQVIPYESGNLQASQNVEANGEVVSISYDTPYAARLYHHPEYAFKRDINRNAKGEWLEDFESGELIRDIYADELKRRI